MTKPRTSCIGCWLRGDDWVLVIRCSNHRARLNDYKSTEGKVLQCWLPWGTLYVDHEIPED